MENLQNARQGLGKMFIASAGAMVSTVLLMIVPSTVILTLPVSLVSGIFSIVGLYQTGKDIKGCRNAFIIAIVYVAVRFFGAFLKSSFNNAIVTIVEYVFSFLSVYLVCTSVSEVMNQIGAAKVAKKGEIAWKIYAGYYGELMIATILALILSSAAIVTFMYFINLLLLLTASVFYMIFLNKSSRALGA